MLIENNEFRGKPSPIEKKHLVAKWRHELRGANLSREHAIACALEADEQRAEAQAKLKPLVADAGRDLRALRDLGMQTKERIDPRWARTLHERAAKAIGELVRMLDQNPGMELSVGDAIVLAAVERLLMKRATGDEPQD